MTNIQIIPPNITFTETAKLLYGGREVHLIFLGGHTPATSVAWLPEERICFAGDIVWVDQHPYMAQADTLQWIEALQFIRELGAEFLVPGHGPICEPNETSKVEEYIRFMRQRVREYYQEDKTKNETKSGLVGEMLGWFPVPPERKAKIESQIKSGLNRVYREIQREEELAAAQAEGRQNGAVAEDEDEEDQDE